MKNAIDKLIGNKIIRIEKIHDYWQIFMDKAIVNIYSAYKILKNGNIIQNDEMVRSEINGLIINKIYETSKYLSLELSGNISIEISISNEDYVSPEVMEVLFKTGEIIVF